MSENIQTDTLLNGYKILQNPKAFMFGIDAVLLANFALCELKEEENILDLCTGNGIIPLLLAGSKKVMKITGVEIQQEAAELAQKSVEINELKNKISIINADLRTIVNNKGKDNSLCNFKKHSFSCITCNPPYMIAGHGKNNPTDAKAIARHEIFCTLEDVIFTAEQLLATHGKFFMIHRPFRLSEIFSIMEKCNLVPKRIQLIQPQEGKEANLVLIEARKNANVGLKVEKVLNVYEAQKETGLQNTPEFCKPAQEGKVKNDKKFYTKEILEIYKSFK